MPEKRKLAQPAKEGAGDAAAKNESPAAFPAVPAEVQAEAARKSLEASARDVVKKADEAGRSRAADSLERAAVPSAAPPAAPAPAPAPALAPAPAPATTAAPLPRPTAPSPFNDLAQRPRASGQLREMDADGAAAPGRRQDVPLAAAPSREEAERAPLAKAQRADAAPPAGAAGAAAPLAAVRAAIAVDPARWSLQTRGGQAVALDARWQAWLADLDAAAAGRWRALDRTGASAASLASGQDGAAQRDSPARRDDATTLRLLNDGRLAAVVRIDGLVAQLDAEPGARAGRWQAALAPADAARLGQSARRLSP
ncbi:MAG TPA: hypothetical protein VLD35_16205 [Caldimonas sp.]|nr:hypothetical protein [Caldimonas sp.]